jgi:hypothetical protein
MLFGQKRSKMHVFCRSKNNLKGVKMTRFLSKAWTKMTQNAYFLLVQK